MSDLKLVIADKNRSPGSLRAWLVLKQLGLEFDEVSVALGRADTEDAIRRHSPSGQLPVLIAGEIRVWDELAIAEFLADHFPSLWPHGAEARALARSVSAELHGGLRALETFLPMDLTARFAPGRLLAPVAAAVRRVTEIITTCRTDFGEGGPFLLGEFTVADAMLAPVCAQLVTHAIPLDGLCRAYVGHMVNLPAMLEWAAGARAEANAAVAPGLPPEPLRPPPVLRDPPRPADPPVMVPAIGVPATGMPSPDEIVPPRPAGHPPSLAAAAIAAALPTGLHVQEQDEEEDGPPAPGLPGVVPTRPYDERAGEEDAAEPGQPRRLLRPPAATGLFRWRQPVRTAAAMPEVPTPPPAAAPPMPPPPPRASRPRPPAAIPGESPPPPAAERAPPPPVVERVEQVEEVAGPPPPAPPRPPPSALPRYGAVKPIGDGIHRRR